MNDLRPVGTTFWHEGQDQNSADSRRFRILYEIIDHTKVLRYAGDKERVLSEEIRPRKLEYWDGKEWKEDGKTSG